MLRQIGAILAVAMMSVSACARDDDATKKSYRTSSGDAESPVEGAESPVEGAEAPVEVEDVERDFDPLGATGVLELTDAPAGAAVAKPETLIQPFVIKRATKLQRQKPGSSHFPAVWSAGNSGRYVNNTGRALSLVKVKVNLDAIPHDPRRNVSAAVDVCLVMKVPGLDTRGTMTGSELLCVGQGKSGGQWPKSELNLQFPGRGHLVPPGAMLICNSQGSAMSQTPSNTLTNFSCQMTLRDADLQAHLPLVQSVRVPYFDESFVHYTSRKSRHTNMARQGDLKIHGIWSFAGLRGNVGRGCFIRSRKTGAPVETCWSLPSNATRWTTQIGFQPIKASILPGQTLSAACVLSKRVTTRRTYCSFYFMVEVTGDNKHYLRPKNTISNWDRGQYCVPNPKFVISDKELRPGCAKRLEQ